MPQPAPPPSPYPSLSLLQAVKSKHSHLADGHQLAKIAERSTPNRT